MATRQLPLLLLLTASSLVWANPAQDEPDVIHSITQALQQGNAPMLARHINPTVEMMILGQENIYSRAQAELILQEFFAHNPPSGFRVNHQGAKRATSFAIGRFSTPTGMLRISLFMKLVDGRMLIHQLRIERDADAMR